MILYVTMSCFKEESAARMFFFISFFSYSLKCKIRRKKSIMQTEWLKCRHARVKSVSCLYFRCLQWQMIQNLKNMLHELKWKQMIYSIFGTETKVFVFFLSFVGEKATYLCTKKVGERLLAKVKTILPKAMKKSHKNYKT